MVAKKIHWNNQPGDGKCKQSARGQYYPRSWRTLPSDPAIDCKACRRLAAKALGDPIIVEKKVTGHTETDILGTRAI